MFDTLDNSAETYSLTYLTFQSTHSGLVNFADLRGLAINGGIGNNNLFIDSSDSLVTIPEGIHFDGGTGLNSITLTQTDGDQQDSGDYHVGPNVGQGSDVIVGPSGTQTIYFVHLVQIFSDVPPPPPTSDVPPPPATDTDDTPGGDSDTPVREVPFLPSPAPVDSTAPTSSVSALASTQTTAVFTVSWSGSDNTDGSGIASYDVYVSDNGSNYMPWQVDVATTSALFTGVDGHTYSFLSVATDNEGNTQPTPSDSQASTKVQTTVATSTSLGASVASIIAGQSVTFRRKFPLLRHPNGHRHLQRRLDNSDDGHPGRRVASYTTSTLAAGSHSITATYNPIAPNLGSASTALIETVTAPPPHRRQARTFTGTAAADIITILPANATGSVTVTISNAATKNKPVVLGTFVPIGRITINALGGNDTLQVSTATIGGKVVSLSSAVSIAFSGGDGLDTLIGGNQANVWNITGLNSGTLNGNAFDGIENLTGGTATDAFRFSTGGSLTGKISGGDGANTLDYSASASANIVNLQTTAATGTAGCHSVTNLVGGSTTTLVGTNKAISLEHHRRKRRQRSGIAFSGMGNITGGTMTDTFILANGEASAASSTAESAPTASATLTPRRSRSTCSPIPPPAPPRNLSCPKIWKYPVVTRSKSGG